MSSIFSQFGSLTVELAAIERLKVPIDLKWFSGERSLPFEILVQKLLKGMFMRIMNDANQNHF